MVAFQNRAGARIGVEAEKVGVVRCRSGCVGEGGGEPPKKGDGEGRRASLESRKKGRVERMCGKRRQDGKEEEKS